MASKTLKNSCVASLTVYMRNWTVSQPSLLTKKLTLIAWNGMSKVRVGGVTTSLETTPSWQTSLKGNWWARSSASPVAMLPWLLTTTWISVCLCLRQHQLVSVTVCRHSSKMSWWRSVDTNAQNVNKKTILRSKWPFGVSQKFWLFTWRGLRHHMWGEPNWTHA